MSGTTLPLSSGPMPVAALGQDPDERLAALRDKDRIGFLGARSCTQYGQHIAAELAAGLRHHDAVLVAVSTFGISLAAVTEALRENVPVVLVLPHGIAADRWSCPPLQERAEDIARTGAIIPLGGERDLASKTLFEAAHTMLTLQSSRVLLVESRSRSTTLAAATSVPARRRFAVPGPVTSMYSAGPHELVRDHGARLVSEVSDLFPTD